MADTDSGSKPHEFIFGQNIEDRVLQSSEAAEDMEKTKDSTSQETEPKTEQGASAPTNCALLRPSAFSTTASSSKDKLNGSGTTPKVTASSSTLLRPSAFTPSTNLAGVGSFPSANPFASKPVAQAVSHGSDSEDEPRQRPVLAPSHFTMAGGAHSSSFRVSAPVMNDATSKFVLRPSALDRQTASFASQATTENAGYRSNFKLEPAKFASPFSNTDIASSDSEQKENRVNGGAAPVAERLESASEKESDSNGTAPDSSSNDSTQPQPEAQADALSDTEATAQAGGSTSNLADSSGGFVFGQNLADRVVSTPTKEASAETSEEATVAESKSPEQSLSKAAEESAAAQQKPDLKEVEITTGEENESNVFQINAKLFLFDNATQNWLEKGRGLLRLNDQRQRGSSAFHSRLVMRTQGSLRVVLNTKVWPGMIIERASQKSIRISAVDPESEIVKLYLIMAAPKEADHIFSAIDWRVQQLKAEDRGQDSSWSESQGASEGDSQPESHEKRHMESPEDTPIKKARIDPEQRRDVGREESNDSSTVDPETEASNESFASSPTIKSSDVSSE